MSPAFLSRPKISVVLCIFFSVIYIVSFLLLFIARLPFWIHFLAGAFLIFHCIYVMRRYVFYRHPLSIIRLWCDKENSWKMQCHDAHVQTAELIQSAIISRYLIFLAFRVPGRFSPFVLPLASDSDHPDTMRLLRQTLLQSSEKS